MAEFLGSGISLPPATFSWSTPSPTLLTSPSVASPSGFNFSPQAVTGVATVIGGIFSAISASQSASAQKDQLKYQSSVAELNANNALVMGNLNAKNAMAIGDINYRQTVNMGEINARLSELAAETELNRGQREYGAFTLKKGAMKSTQRASLAANGIDLGVGSALETLTTTDIMGEIDGQTIVSNAVRAAWGYQTQAVISRTSAAVAANNARSTGQNAANNYSAAGNMAFINASNQSSLTRIQSDAISPTVAGTTSLLGSATRAADTWYKYRRDSELTSKFGSTLD